MINGNFQSFVPNAVYPQNMSKSEDCSLFLQYPALTVAYKTQYKLFICDP